MEEQRVVCAELGGATECVERKGEVVCARQLDADAEQRHVRRAQQPLCLAVTRQRLLMLALEEC